MNRLLYALFFCSGFFISCISQSEHDKALAEKETEINTCLSNITKSEKFIRQLTDSIKKINAELENYRTNPSSVFAQAQNAYSIKDRDAVLKSLSMIQKYHPESEYLSKTQALLTKLEKELEAIRIAEEKRIEAERKAEERRAAEEERRNPHTPKGLAKKAARGGWVLGIWRLGSGNYTTIVNRNGTFYMCDMFPSNSDIYDEQKLRQVGDGMYQCVDDEDDTIYIVAPNGLAAYNYGTQVAFWEPL